MEQKEVTVNSVCQKGRIIAKRFSIFFDEEKVGDGSSKALFVVMPFHSHCNDFSPQERVRGVCLNSQHPGGGGELA